MNLVSDPWAMWMIGFVIGVAVASVSVYALVKTRMVGPAPTARGVVAGVKNAAPALIVAFVVLALVAPQAVTLAQTPVPIVIDTNEIFTQTNNWIQQFTPIQAIGIGASLALAILGFLAAVLTGAFRGARIN